MKLFITLSFCAFMLPLACDHNEPPPVPPPLNYVPPIDAGPDANIETEDEARTSCGAACINLRRLNCAEGHTTPAGSRCYDVCKNSSFHRPDCVKEAKSVDELKKCNVRCVSN